MRFSKRKIITVFFCFLIGFSKAQKSVNHFPDTSYRALHWGTDEGLPYDQTYCMIKDINGFIWIGTQNGLSRFDGSSFTNFYYDPKKQRSISGPMILGLVEDSLHNIWVGTNKGLSRFDIKADTFTNFFTSFSAASFSPFIIPFWVTKNEVYCREADSLITSYNIHSFEKKILMKLDSSDSTVNSNYSRQYSFIDTISKSVWMLERCHDSSGGLLEVSLLTGKRTHHTWECTRNIPNHCHWSEAMCYDKKRNSLWLNSSDGLMQFTFDDKQFHPAAGMEKFLNLKSYGHYVGISIDPDGRIWLATYPVGIIIYNPADYSSRLVFPEDNLIQKKVSYENGLVYCDRDGIVWSGFWLRKGVYQFIPFSQPVTRYLADTTKNNPWKNIILNCVQSDHEKIWMGTDEDGIISFDQNTHRVFTVIRPTDIPGTRDKTCVIPVLIDSIRQKAFLRTEYPAALYELNLHSKKLKKIIFIDSTNNPVMISKINSCLPFRNGSIISASTNDHEKIYMIDTGNAIATEISSMPLYFIDGEYTATDGFKSLFLRRPDFENNLSYSFNNNKWTVTHTPFDTLRWESIVYNKEDKSYWAIIPREIIHYNENFSRLRNYTPSDGLPMNEIFILIPDNKGNIWFNTNRYIYQLNTKSGVIMNLSQINGFKPVDFRGGQGGMKDGNGNLYFPGHGTGQGFSIVKQDRLVSTNASVYLKSIEIRKFNLPSTLSPNSLKELLLSYDQNRISIETGTIDFYSNGKGHIRYKLYGRDGDWQYAPANYLIRFEELSPGSYTLMMQAGNAGNEFTGPVKTLLIQIRPAFWNTWWFWTITGCFTIFLIYGLIRWRLNQKFKLQLENSEKEKIFAEMRRRTAELQQQTTDLEMQALRAQMNPHFIFNSLNSINRFILQNDRTQASEYLTKFSKLVRLILQNSQASLISLESELESLELYLDLEALRFDHHFKYKISVQQDVDISELKVPPLIIQPYAENAIWHGLMHREEKGQLDIEVSLEKENLYFKITDNGIGRKQAAALSSKSATKHKSMGLQITASRIAMMKNQNGNGSNVIINDLVHPDGAAAGTEVIIKIPVIYD